MTSPPLFRPQAVAHAAGSPLGRIVLARPPGWLALTFAACLVVAVVLVYLGLGTYTRKAQVMGVLLPSHGLIRVLPAHAGVVAARHVHEGQSVRAGDALFLVTNERSDGSRASAEVQISTLLRRRRDSLAAERSQQQHQAQQKVQALRGRAGELSTEMQRLDAQLDLQSRRVALAQSNLQRFTELADASFVSSAQVHDKQAELLDQQQRQADLMRAQAGLRREAIGVEAEMRDLELQARRDEQASQRATAALEQDLVENEARREVVVRAPQDGTVSAIAFEVGQTVSANQALAALVPAGSELEAELYAPSRAAGFIRPGMQVLLRYQAYAYQKFGQARGTVREVAASALRADELPLSGVMPSGTAGEPLYRVRVRLDRQDVTVYGRPLALRTGALLDASILLEQRRLYEWLLDPLYSAMGRV
ncbi:HlyD family secretion protein [Ramlibacter sp. MMS24-I3-19]|uniref:HlyD family secretion protein n=1 Tax=Ramlibacter sp. MMS24-I3-19 TaxID=3416606 RepID=UPI003D048CDC